MLDRAAAWICPFGHLSNDSCHAVKILSLLCLMASIITHLERRAEDDSADWSRLVKWETGWETAALCSSLWVSGAIKWLGWRMWSQGPCLPSSPTKLNTITVNTGIGHPYLCHCHWYIEEVCFCRCCWSSGCDGWGWMSLGSWGPRCLQQVP